MKVKIIVAYDDNRVIGYKNKLPWHISEDLKHFKDVTMGYPVIMGRNTWASLPKKLHGRYNIVLSSTLVMLPDQPSKRYCHNLSKLIPYESTVPANNPDIICSSLGPALEAAEAINNTIWTQDSSHNMAYIIGGADVYHNALFHDVVDEILVTKVHGVHKGDRTFRLLPLDKTWKVDILERTEKFDRLLFKRIRNEKKEVGTKRTVQKQFAF